ncbi:MAG: pyruvate kinase [Candidatus Saccharimonas sp.]|nr:pyruvate kinase [Planctomycetaceae bacterium]
MDLWHRQYMEGPLVKTKIVATLGPASETPEKLQQLVEAGVDLFRLNFAHGSYPWFEKIVSSIREFSRQHGRPVGILGDLSGPKIRLGVLPDEGLRLRQGAMVEFVRVGTDASSTAPVPQLTCTYEPLVDDLRVGDRVLLADGTVSLRVVEQDSVAGRVVCEVVQAGLIRSKQGVNLPGVALSTPCLTDKDRADLTWALDHGIDYIGLSFVRCVNDILLLRQAIADHPTKNPPWIVAKIEKTEAIAELEGIVAESDAVMVARGDLGVETDIFRVPTLQKQIIRLCNEHRTPVITATQMLDSMQKNELPTRAEASDVFNAVLDGTDAVMLSGETAAGDYPVEAVAMMSRIAREAERLLEPRLSKADSRSLPRNRATAITEAVTHGAATAASHLGADLIVAATRGGKTAMAISKQRPQVPILALTDHPEVARRMCLFWGVTPVETMAVQSAPRDLLAFVQEFGRKHKLLDSGSKLVLVGSSDWALEWHDMMLVHVVS